ASVHRRQDNIVQDVRGQRPLQWTRIQTGRYHDDEVQGWNHEDTLSAKSETGSPSDLALVHQRPANPHLVTIEEDACTLDLRGCRFVQIVSWDDLPTLPEAVRQYQLAELGHVAGAQAQAPRRGGVAVSIVRPLEIDYAEGFEKHSPRKHVETLAGRCVQNGTQQLCRAAAIIVLGAGRRHDGLREHIPVGIERLTHADGAVIGVSIGRPCFIPVQSRGHGQQVTKRDARLFRGAEVSVCRKEVEDWLIEAGQLLLGQRDPDEQGGHGFADRTQVMQHCLVIGDLSDGAAPTLVIAWVILFENQFALPYDKKSVDIVPRCDEAPRRPLPQRRRIEADLFRFCRAPAVFCGDRSATVWRSLPSVLRQTRGIRYERQSQGPEKEATFRHTGILASSAMTATGSPCALYYSSLEQGSEVGRRRRVWLTLP